MRESTLPKALNRKRTETTYLNRIKLLEKLVKDEEPKTKSQLQYYFETREKRYPVFAGIDIKDFLELQNILSDIDRDRIWTMEEFVKFIIKWFIAYYSGETDKPPFVKVKKRFITKEIRRFYEVFKDFMEE